MNRHGDGNRNKDKELVLVGKEKHDVERFETVARESEHQNIVEGSDHLIWQNFRVSSTFVRL
jgi:hypothetical protein